MALNRTNLTLASGEDRTYALKARTANFAVLNLTGAVLTWRLKDGNGGLVKEVAGTVTSAALGTYSVALTDADALLPAGDYSHETLAVIAGATTVCNAGLLRVAAVIGRTPQSLPGAVVVEADDDEDDARFFATKAAAQIATIAASVAFVWTAGAALAGDGKGALYKRVTAQPSHSIYFQSADGAYWEGATWGNFDGRRGFLGANIWRFEDRLFLGDAALNWAGATDPEPLGSSWLSDVSAAPKFLGTNALFLSTTSDVDSNGRYAVVGAAHLSTSQAASAIGVAGAAVNNSATAQAWGLYSDLISTAAGYLCGLEIAAKNAGSDHSDDVYSTDNKGILGLQLSGGGDNSYGPTATNPSNTGIMFINNASTWNRGIIFKKGALTGTDGSAGSSGTGVAIRMARRHAIQWMAPDGNLGGMIISNCVTGASGVMRQIFVDSAIQFTGPNGAKRVATIEAAASHVNYLTLGAAATGSGPALSANGDDTDIDLPLTPKGAGVVKFGTNTAKGAEAFASFITIKDSGGTSRKVMVCA